MSIAPHGPFTLEAKFHLTNGTDEAQVSFDCPVGNLPLESGIATLAQKALAAAQDGLGPEWRFQSRDEFVQSRLSEQAGSPSTIRFAVPEGRFEHDWANPA